MSSSLLLCDRCSGRGWVYAKSATDFSDPCPLCKGKGSFTLYKLSRLLNEQLTTLKRVAKGKARASTCARVFEKVMELLETP